MAPSSMVAARKRAQNGKNQANSGNKRSKHDFHKNGIDENNKNENQTDSEEDDVHDNDKHDDDKHNKHDDGDGKQENGAEKHNDDDDEEETVSNKVIERVSDKNNVTITIVDLFLDDAPATELPGTLEAAIKNVVDTALFRGVKFFKNTKSASRIVGFVFQNVKMGGDSHGDKLLQTKFWNATCDFISFRTGHLRQQCIDRWYAVGYGKKYCFCSKIS